MIDVREGRPFFGLRSQKLREIGLAAISKNDIEATNFAVLEARRRSKTPGLVEELAKRIAATKIPLVPSASTPRSRPGRQPLAWHPPAWRHGSARPGHAASRAPGRSGRCRGRRSFVPRQVNGRQRLRGGHVGAHLPHGAGSKLIRTTAPGLWR